MNLARKAVCAVCLVAGVAGGPGLALEEPSRPLPPAGGPAWKPLEFPSITRHTTYEQVEVEGRAAVLAKSDCSASALFTWLEGFDLEETPFLGWEWKVEREPAAPDPRTRDGDDFAARVYVMFEFEPAHASLWERLRHRVASSSSAYPIPGTALNYVVSSRESAGASWPNPWNSSAQMFSLGSEAVGAWQQVRVDLRSDYARVFGRTPPKPIGVALMTDSDNGCASATAWFARFEFLGSGH